MSLLKELERRNVIRVAVAYLAGAWLLIQVLETMLPLFDVSAEVTRLSVIVLAIGFVPAIIVSWIFQLTPTGIVKDSGDEPAAPGARRRLDRLIIVFLAFAVVLFATHTFILDPLRDQQNLAEATEEARKTALIESYGDKSIAVLPFVNLSSDPEQEHFGDGLAEELLHLLEKIEELRVISRTSAFSFKESDLNLAEIAEALNVATILEGSVRRSGDKIRITAQLIDAQTDTHIWSETFDRELNDIFAIQDEVAAAVVESLKLELDVLPPTTERIDVRAYSLYLQAKPIIYSADPTKAHEGVELLERALEIEPDYVEAMIDMGVGITTMERGAAANGDVKEYERLQARGEELLQRAQKTDPDHGSLNAILGWRELLGNKNPTDAARLFEVALDADRTNINALLGAQYLFRVLGDSKRAIAIGEYVVAREPVLFWGYRNLADSYRDGRQFDKALEAYEIAAAISPNSEAVNWRTGMIWLYKGEPETALEYFKKEAEEYPAHPYGQHGLAMAYYDLGEPRQSERAIQAMQEMLAVIEGPGADWNYGYARLHAWLGNDDEAFRYLEQTRSTDMLIDSRNHPVFDRIRDDARWSEIMGPESDIGRELAEINFQPRLPTELQTGI